MYVCLYVCMWVYMCDMHVCMHVCMYVYMYVCTYVCMYVWHACMYVCMYVCFYVCMCGMHVCTRSDNEVMRLIPKKIYFFIHQLQCGHLQSTSLVPAHTFSSGAATVCSIPWRHFVGRRLRPALQTSGCLLLTQNGVLSVPILLFEIKISRKVRDQVSKEAAASP